MFSNIYLDNICKLCHQKKETIQQTKGTSLEIQSVPVSPFADFTNLHMLFQQQYPAAQLMNSLTLNKDKAEDEEVIK